jgi:hypothetical protein
MEDIRGIDLNIHEMTPVLLVAGVPSHEQAGITVSAVDLASRVGIEAVVEDFGPVQDTFCPDFSDLKHGISPPARK